MCQPVAFKPLLAEVNRANGARFTFRASMDSLALTLIKESLGRKLARIAVSNLRLDLTDEDARTSVPTLRGSLGNLVIRDLSTPHTKYPELVSVRHGAPSLLSFVFEHGSPQTRRPSMLRAEVGPIDVLYLQQLTSELVDYLMAGVLGALITDTARTIESASADLRTLSNMRGAYERVAPDDVPRFDDKLDSPCVIVPSSSHSQDSIRIGAGSLAVRNHVEIDADGWVVNRIRVDLLEADIRTSGSSSLLREKVTLRHAFSAPATRRAPCRASNRHSRYQTWRSARRANCASFRRSSARTWAKSRRTTLRRIRW